MVWIFFNQVDCDYTYNSWDVVSGTLGNPSEEEQADLGLQEDELLKFNYIALLTMRKIWEKDPDGLIRQCDYASEAYEILQTHYQFKMV